MEKIVYILLTAVLFSVSAKAQGSYETGMNEALKLWEEDKTAEAIARFEEVGEAENDQWLPYYYASEIKIIEAFEMTDAVKKERQLEEAKALLEKAKSLEGADPVELLVLEAMLHTGYITLDPMQYGPSLSPVVVGVLDRAALMEPSNPRVALFEAEWNIGAAPYMGEDPKTYCDDLRESLKLFANYQSKETFAPDWGEERAKAILGELCGDK